MATLYSALLWDPSPVNLTTATSSNVPTGFIWVVRDIVANNDSAVQNTMQGFQLWVASTGAFLASIVKPYGVFQWQYRWELRQVINPGDHLVCQSYDNGWYIRVSGYKLSTP